MKQSGIVASPDSMEVLPSLQTRMQALLVPCTACQAVGITSCQQTTPLERAGDLWGTHRSPWPLGVLTLCTMHEYS
jgi:hypothetical protein